jgi:hypothetical protein
MATVLRSNMATSPALDRRQSSLRACDILIDEQIQTSNIRKKAGLFSKSSTMLFSSLRGTEANKSILKYRSEEQVQSIKLCIMKCNPAIYQRFRNSLVSNVYTNWGASYCLREFMDQELRIPELREEIHSFCHDKTSRGAGLFAYLTGGESSPGTTRSTIRSLVRVREDHDECDHSGTPSMDSTEASDQEEILFESRHCYVESARLDI